MKFYICKTCGKIIAIVKETAVPTMCCGQKMEEIVPGTTDAAVEKHVPVFEIKDQKVFVTVGEVTHPMIPEHYIEWIAIETTGGYRRTESLFRALRRRRSESGIRLLQSSQPLESIIRRN